MARARYKQVVDRLADDISSGKIPPGTRLPTHRELSAQEGLALVTATRVYAELAAMGLVSGEAGRGTFVRESSQAPRHALEQRAFADGIVDLNFNYPSLPGQTDLLRTALRALATSGDLEALLRYQLHGGRMHERASVALHLEERGLSVPADRVLIVSGAQHGMAVAALAMLQPGDVVAVDALTYPGSRCSPKRTAWNCFHCPRPPTDPIWTYWRDCASPGGSARSTRFRRCTTRWDGS